MAVTPTLEREAIIESERRMVRTAPERDLRALAEQLVISSHRQDLLLRSAMRRIAELELGRELANPQATAQAIRSEQRQLTPWGRWFGWLSRWGRR